MQVFVLVPSAVHVACFVTFHSPYVCTPVAAIVSISSTPHTVHVLFFEPSATHVAFFVITQSPNVWFSHPGSFSPHLVHTLFS